TSTCRGTRRAWSSATAASTGSSSASQSCTAATSGTSSVPKTPCCAPWCARRRRSVSSSGASPPSWKDVSPRDSRTALTVAEQAAAIEREALDGEERQTVDEELEAVR